MTAEPTCLFCKMRLGLGQPMYDTKDWKTVSQTASCRKCMVTQTFTPAGKPMSYSFQVDIYTLDFDLEHNKFTIREKNNYSNILASCDYIPINMTPSNTTKEKIQTLILFS